MSLKFAINSNNMMVHVMESQKAEPYQCPFCCVPVYKRTSKLGNPFYSCFKENLHKNETCRYLSKTAITHTTENFDPDIFFSKLLQSEHTPKRGKRVITEDIEKINSSTIGIPDSQLGENKDIEVEPGTEKPYSSLRQIWQEGLPLVLSPNYMLCSRKATEVFIFRKWFRICFEMNQFDGGPRVIQARPDHIIWTEQAIQFVFLGDKIGKNKWKKRFFRVYFTDYKVFSDYVKKLFRKDDNKTGKFTWNDRRIWVLIAGEWIISKSQVDEHDCFQCDFKNERQIYVCPKANTKKK